MNHRRIAINQKKFFPAYVVWELTLKCDQTCAHCGSRAGFGRSNELTMKEALDLTDQLIQMKPKEVVLIGGEAYLHEGFFEIIKKLSYHNIHVTMTTGGRGVTPEMAREAFRSGLESVSVSIDGLEDNHDLIRRAKGSFQTATNALHYFKEAGCTTASNTNINRINKEDIEELFLHLKSNGISSWQLQITTPLGRAADRPNLILQPWDLIDLMPRIAEIKKKAFANGILIMPGNNLGYFGPEEANLRSLSLPGKDHWMGCQAGRFVMGIESHGTIKGCPSLQSVPYVGGNIREKSLADIWNNSPELSFTRNRSVENLWGFCRICPFAKTCLGGCSFTSHSLFGKPGNNPYCHYRAKTLAKQNKRERLVLRENAPSIPFDNGLFEIIEEPFDMPELDLHTSKARIKKIQV
jgi:radical SAM protein with 4Fe4S-binding SPASM domain